MMICVLLNFRGKFDRQGAVQVYGFTKCFIPQIKAFLWGYTKVIPTHPERDMNVASLSVFSIPTRVSLVRGSAAVQWLLGSQRAN